MISVWQSYLPYHVAEELLHHPEQNPVGQQQRFPAVVLFSDVSGFTAISEALAATGKRGAEELTRILNSYFEPMTALIQSYGGIISKFGGDAMTVLFPYTPETERNVTRAAVQCALDMQSRMGEYAAIEAGGATYSLTMKAGLARGPVFCTTVGDPAVRLEYIVAGTVLDRCAEAEHHATRGEVVVAGDLVRDDPAIVVTEQRGNFNLVAQIGAPVAPRPLPLLDGFDAIPVSLVAAYMHPNIAQRLRDGQTNFINEHRRVTVLFVSFHAFDYDHDPAVAAKLQTYLDQIFQIVQRYDGYVNKVDMGDKGSKYIVLFGAPIAHEDDPERALRCALEIRDLPHTVVRIGVNTGFVFCGEVGSALRREYTVMGDAVNVAARLMQAAEPAHIMVSAATFAVANASFAWDRRTRLRLKGKREPVAVYALRSLNDEGMLRLQATVYGLPMIGRRTELAAIQDRIHQTLEGNGQVVGITAEAGMGKSRLAAEAINDALGHGFHGLVGECLSHATNSSYLVWHTVLRTLFQVDRNQPKEALQAYLEAQLTAIDPQFVERMPLLDLPLGIMIPDNPLTQTLDPKSRKAALESLVADCIRHHARQAPLMLVFDDMQWIDPLSLDLLEEVARSATDVRVCILLMYRPYEEGRAALSIGRLPYWTEIQLTEFDRASAEQLIHLKVGQLYGTATEVSEELTTRIVDRAQGNPFYIDEMVNLIHSRGIDPGDTESLQSFDLPDSLHSLILSRLDQVEEGAKTTLKVASVIGRTFRANWLWHVYPEIGTPARVKSQLHTLQTLDLTVLDRPEPDPEYIFKHVVTREVAYESLSVATRALLHEQTGHYVETAYRDRQEQYLDLLAYHYGASFNAEKQREYFRRAGDAAQSVYANEAAIAYYQRLLAIEPAHRQIEIMLKLGQVLQLTGKWSDAESLYQRALSLSTELVDRHAEAQCLYTMGMLLRAKGAYTDAITRLEQARRCYASANDQQGVIDVVKELGVVYAHQGDCERALSEFEQYLDHAMMQQDQQGIKTIMNSMGVVHYSQGNYDRALFYFEQGKRLATELGDRLMVGKSVNNMGNVYLDKGALAQAFDCYVQYLQVAQELGFREGVVTSILNMGNIYVAQGYNEAALACNQKVLQMAFQLGARDRVAQSLGNVARILHAQGALEQAADLFQQTIALSRALDAPYDLCDALSWATDLAIDQHRLLEARAMNDEALSVGADSGYREILFAARLQQIRLDYLTGASSRTEADAVVAEMLQEWTDLKEQAAILYECWGLNDRGESGREAAATAYRDLYARTPDVTYRRRYEQLTGDLLPDPPALPPLPQIVTGKLVDLPSLLDQVDGLLEELHALA